MKRLLLALPLVLLAAALFSRDARALCAASMSAAGSCSDVTGPASSTDNAVARFDGTGGKTLQDSGVLVDDNVQLGINDPTPDAQLDVTVGDAARVGQVIDLAASQTADAFQVKDSLGTTVFQVAPDGALSVPGAGTNSLRLGLNTTASAQNSIAIGASASATGIGAIVLGEGGEAPGNYQISIGSLLTPISAYNNTVSINALATASGQFNVGWSTRPITDVYIGSGITNSTPGNTTYHATGGSGTDVAGADLLIAGGQGTGTGSGGAVVLQVAPASGTSSSTQNSVVDALHVDESGVGLKDLGTKPTCSASLRGKIWFDEGGTGVADTVEICAKNSSDTYAWYALATIP